MIYFKSLFVAFVFFFQAQHKAGGPEEIDISMINMLERGATVLNLKESNVILSRAGLSGELVEKNESRMMS